MYVGNGLHEDGCARTLGAVPPHLLLSRLSSARWLATNFVASAAMGIQQTDVGIEGRDVDRVRAIEENGHPHASGRSVAAASAHLPARRRFLPGDVTRVSHTAWRMMPLNYQGRSTSIW